MKTATLGLPAILNANVSNGGVNVALQDQTTQQWSQPLHQNGLTFAIRTEPVVGDYVLDITSGHSLIAGDCAHIEVAARGIWVTVLGATIDTITIDQPIDFAFPVGSDVHKCVVDLSTFDGSTTPEVAHVINQVGSPYSVDVTWLSFSLIDSTDMADDLFGGSTALTRGFLLRRVFANGDTINLANFKINANFKEFSQNPEPYSEKAGGAKFGFAGNALFGSQSGYGTVIRLDPGDVVQGLIQDDLTAGSLTSFKIRFHGHIVD